jgi:hypothetical protein
LALFPARRFAPARTGSGDHRVCARTAWRHRCSGASCRALARRWTLKPQPSFPEDGCGSNPALKQPRHPHKRRMRRLHAARRVEAGKRDIQRDDRCGFIAMGQRDRARRLQRAAGERTGAARGNSAAPPHFRSTLFKGLSDSSASRWLDCMRCSVALEVMPHSATSRATGDDTSTIRSWNSGV